MVLSWYVGDNPHLSSSRSRTSKFSENGQKSEMAKTVSSSPWQHGEGIAIDWVTERSSSHEDGLMYSQALHNLVSASKRGKWSACDQRD
jgi:hypothetical protein